MILADPTQYPSELIIEVSQEDIDNGTPDVCTSCPVALALHRMGYIASVDDKEILIDDIVMYYNDFELREFVQSFDGNESVQPCIIVVSQREG